MPRGAAAAEVTRARRGRPADHSGDLGHHFPPNTPRGRSGRYLPSIHLGIPERNNAIYRGCASPPQTDALSLAVRRVSVCFPSTKIRCTGSGVFDGHHGRMARAAGAVPGADGRPYCDPVNDRYLYYLWNTRNFLIAYAWLKNYRSILKCAVCAFQTTNSAQVCIVSSMHRAYSKTTHM